MALALGFREEAEVHCMTELDLPGKTGLARGKPDRRGKRPHVQLAVPARNLWKGPRGSLVVGRCLEGMASVQTMRRQLAEA